MMVRATTDSVISTLTWGAAVVFGALAAWWAPSELRVLVIGLSLTSDIVLAVALVAARARSKRLAEAQRQDVQAALNIVLDLTNQQRAGWSGLLGGIAALEPEDRVLFEPLLQNHRELGAVTNGQTTGSIIDALQTIIIVNQSLMDDLGRVLAFYESTYQRLQNMRKINRVNHFRLHESVDFLSDIGTASNHYSEALVLEILTTFRGITQLADDMKTDVVGTMNDLMAPGNTTGLATILQKSSQISGLMDVFFADLSQATSSSQKSVAENIQQMEHVKEMSDAIGEFSESIRMISLNLNIEAARGHGGNGKGFQVLAVKLSEFALRAQSLAAEQHKIIETASQVMITSGEHEVRRLRGLLARVPELRSNLDPFEGIVQRTFGEFENVGSGMTKLATSIGEELRDVIGKLQFQDLVRQEHEHVLSMFAHVRDLADEATAADGVLEPTHQHRLREAIIHHFECLATTENEWNVVRTFRKRYPEISQDGTCSDPDDEPGSTQAGKVELF